MVTHRITVRGRKLSGVPFSVVQGCRSADALEFDLDGDFDGAELVEVIVYPRDGSRAAESCVYDGGPVTLPDSAYEAPGWLGLAVLATKPGGELVMTAERSCAIQVLASWPMGTRGGERHD